MQQTPPTQFAKMRGNRALMTKIQKLAAAKLAREESAYFISQLSDPPKVVQWWRF